MMPFLCVGGGEGGRGALFQKEHGAWGVLRPVALCSLVVWVPCRWPGTPPGPGALMPPEVW